MTFSLFQIKVLLNPSLNIKILSWRPMNHCIARYLGLLCYLVYEPWKPTLFGSLISLKLCLLLFLAFFHVKLLVFSVTYFGHLIYTECPGMMLCSCSKEVFDEWILMICHVNPEEFSFEVSLAAVHGPPHSAIRCQASFTLPWCCNSTLGCCWTHEPSFSVARGLAPSACFACLSCCSWTLLATLQKPRSLSLEWEPEWARQLSRKSLFAPPVFPDLVTSV